MERIHVRIPDAAPGDADLREHAPRPDVQSGREKADQVWSRARRTMGYFRVRLQHDRCAAQLPVPRIRRPRPRAETRTSRGSCHCAICVGSRLDGGT